MVDLGVIDIFFIEWDKHILYGWERAESILVVDAIINGIEAGDEFPPVYIHRINGNEYELSIEKRVSLWWGDGNLFAFDGGHCRGCGHFIADKPLKCILLSGRSEYHECSRIPISKIVLKDDMGEYRERAWAFRYR